MIVFVLGFISCLLLLFFFAFYFQFSVVDIVTIFLNSLCFSLIMKYINFNFVTISFPLYFYSFRLLISSDFSFFFLFPFFFLISICVNGRDRNKV